jgi:hypothetical protein
LIHHHSAHADSRRRETRRPILCGQEVPVAGHICAFFNSNEEKYSTLAPFFADAIQAGDTVIDVMEESSCAEHVEALSGKGIDVRAAVEGGRLRLSTCEQTYQRNGKLDLDAVLDMLSETLHAARNEGRCVRTCGEMNWIAGSRATSRAMEYEARVNEFVPTFECTLMCVYDLAQTPSTLMSDILATHPFAVINGRLRANPYAVEPAEYMKMLRAGKRFAS